MTFLVMFAYHSTMHFGLLRLAAIIVLTLSLCVLSGAVTTVLAVAQQVGQSGDCCPSDRTDDPAAEACCISPECQCLSCLIIELQQVSLTLRGTADTDSFHQEKTTTLTGGNYRTIDYPPEAA